MTLVDTSVWIEHFRRGDERLRTLLEQADVLMHRYVLGEIACGSLRDRSRTLTYLATLPRATTASDDEVLALIDRRRLWGKGIGWVDTHLLASALIEGAQLITYDERLAQLASTR